MSVLKLRYTVTIIIVGEVVFLILFALYRLDMIELKTLVTLVVVEIMAGVLGYYIGRWGKKNDIEIEIESKNKERERVEAFIHGHNQDLINNVFKKSWGLTGEILPDDKLRAIDHLHSGYPEIWNSYLKENSLEIPLYMMHDAKYFEEKGKIIAINIEFKKRLYKIVDDFEKNHIELEGHCSRCETWKAKQKAFK